MKYPTTATVCAYLRHHQRTSMRGMAHMLRVAPSTWSRYERGLTAPGAHMKRQLVNLAGCRNFHDLIQRAISGYY